METTPPSSALYERVCDWSNLLLAYARASRRKRGRAATAAFDSRLADNLLALREELLSRKYRPGAYQTFLIRDPKMRLIAAAPFRDRVVHHALCNVIEPIFEKRFIYDSYANRRGKGTHAALDRAQAFARSHPDVLQCDVRQHFPAIDHEVMRDLLAKVVHDEDCLWLCDQILASGVAQPPEHEDMAYFPGDDLFAACRPRGLPIGNLTSQFWSNCYLDSLDQFVKRTLRCRAYVRYVDDFLMFASDKRTLWRWKAAAIQRLERLRLTIHLQRAHVRRATDGFPWLGFVVFPTHRRLRRRNVVNYRRRLARLLSEYRRGEVSFAEVAASVRGWLNFSGSADTWGLRRQTLARVTL